MPLTHDEVSELLSQPLLGHIAVVKDGKKPHVTPIWVYYDGGLFYFTTRLSRLKGKAISKDGSVAISIATNERPYRAVVVEGEAEVVEENKLELLRKISSKYGREEGERWLEYSRKEPDRVAMVVRPRRILSWHYGRGDYRKQNEGASMRTIIENSSLSNSR